MRSNGISVCVRVLILSLLAAGTLNNQARAVFVEPAGFVAPGWTVPANNGQASATGTTTQEWDVFTSVQGVNVPDIANFNPNGTPDAFDSSYLTSGSFLAGPNIYSPFLPITPRALIPTFNTAGHLLNVVVQVQSRGNAIGGVDTVDPLFVALTANGVSVETLNNYSHTSSIVGSLGAQGSIIDNVWKFQLAADPASLQLDWGWGVESASLDVIRVDTQSAPVPEPASIVSLIIGSVGLAAWGWRRSRSRK